MSKLTSRQYLFVEEYLRCFNATQAAIKAGYSERTARSQGQRLLTNVDVKKKIDKEMARLRERMSSDANKAYALLWQQLSEIEEKLHRHEEASAELNKLNKRLVEIEQNRGNIKDSKQKTKVIQVEKQIWLPFLLKPHNWLKAQELRANLLRDILDRGGYKATERLEMDAAISSQQVDLTGLSVEELRALAKIDKE
ncbi:terminase small subunit [Halalkalibacterium halodurans]|uniref:terminase small subunit n=1 Tax=Halalkalibacterium halodurans TaxID=86665 RepID=UPI002E2040D6|nr:terminase small subunit [Halalkalibacterium halodurans]